MRLCEFSGRISLRLRHIGKVSRSFRGRLHERASPVSRAGSARRASPVSIEFPVIRKLSITWQTGWPG